MGNQVKVLLTHRFFWPNASPYGLLLKNIADSLSENGHAVDVFTSSSVYHGISETNELIDKLSYQVLRIPLFPREKSCLAKRVLNLIIYSVSIIFVVLIKRPKVVSVSTYPPVLAGWAGNIACCLTDAKLVYHVQDIHPEVSCYSGQRLGRGIAYSLLLWLDNQTLRRANRIITLSTDMSATLRDRGLGKLPICVVNNPPLEASEPQQPASEEDCGKMNVCRIIFAGNLGRYQNLLLLTEGIARCLSLHHDLELMFLGDGVMLPVLKERWGDHPQICFKPFVPYSQAIKFFQQSRIGLASLSPNMYRVAYPSKITTYLQNGLKVLALVEPCSQIAQDLINSGRGVVPDRATPGAISEALEKLLSSEFSSAVPFDKLSGDMERPQWNALFTEFD